MKITSPNTPKSLIFLNLESYYQSPNFDISQCPKYSFLSRKLYLDPDSTPKTIFFSHLTNIRIILNAAYRLRFLIHSKDFTRKRRMISAVVKPKSNQIVFYPSVIKAVFCCRETKHDVPRWNRMSLLFIYSLIQ